MQRIIFKNSEDALNPNDYQIEECYQENKEFDVICISNCLLLDRFRLGVKRKEIPPFKLIIEDIGYDPINNDCTVEDVCKTGDLCEAWDSEILNTRISIIMELI